MKIEQRFEMAQLIKAKYPNFVDFCYDGLEFLGFQPTRMQLHIAKALNMSPDRFMIMAARGEGKTMITALYAVWTLIQDPTKIILVVSGFGEKAEEIAKLIYQVIMQWDILVYLRPDTSRKDLNSASKFDVHWALKGINQSPSVTCLGITASLVGRRADLLISDDVETITNGMTPAQRDKLDRLTQEYTAIVTHGKIVYLGTPQTKDSIYNRLPAKGYEIKIFPARYPTKQDIEKYGDKLADYIVEDIKKHGEKLQTGGGISGKLGQPVDPMRYDEQDLIEKETELGSEGFALQYMLDTELSDALRQQLKPSDLIVANFGMDRVPEKINWAAIQQHQVRFPQGFGAPDVAMYYGIIPQCDWADKPKDRVYCYIDPAGGGQDEIGWSIGFSQAPYIHWVYTGGLRGGLTESNTNHMIDTFCEYGVTRILVETNMGHGLFEINLRKAIAERIKYFEDKASKLQIDKPLEAKILRDKARILSKIGIESEYSTDQKERRIIDSLVSTMQRHYLVVHESVFTADAKYNAQYGSADRSYSVFYQMENITTDRNSLKHDDRLESLAGMVRMFKFDLLVDEDVASEKRREAAAREFLENPLGLDANALAQIKGREVRSRIRSRRKVRRNRM